MDTNNTVYVKDKFLTSQECHTLIDFFNKYYEQYGILFDDRKIIHIPKITVDLSNDDPRNDADLLKHITSKLEHNIKNIDTSAYVNYSHITMREIDNYQEYHYDFNYHTYTSVLYLNDDFEGGETEVEDKVIEPLQGSLITFAGNVLQHRVLPVKQGKRYTILVWYKSLVI
mgnify:CR=1 FL=1